MHMTPEQERQIAGLRAAYESGALDKETYEAAVSGILGLTFHAETENSIIAQDRSKALGERAINVENATTGPILTGDHNKLVDGPYYERYFEAAPGEAVDINALRTTYLGRVLRATSALPLAGIDRVDVQVQETAALDAGDSQLPLQAVYTALMTTASEGSTDGLLPGPLEDGETAVAGMLGRGRIKSLPISALEQLDSQAHLVLLGDPGSGKSTFVNFVAACLAGELLGREDVNLALLTRPLLDDDGDDQETPQPWRHGPLLPLCVILRELAANALPAPDEPATADHLWDYLSLHSHTPAFIPFLQETFQHNGGLLLLDGLDEVPEAQARRAQIVQLVADLKATLPKMRILVTSRIYAYRQQDWQLSGFTAVVLAPFTGGQIRRFIERWYAYSAEGRGWTRAKAAQDAVQLWQTVSNRRELRDLAERPLLLTLMTSLHAWRGGTLPGRRALLYDETVDLLLNRWENLRLAKDPETGQPLHKSLAEVLKVGPEALRRMLEKLAYAAHASQPDVKRDQPVDLPEATVITSLLSLSPREDLQPRLLASYLRDRAGLLVDRGGGIYTFPHRTFQEFLAACYAADRNRIEPLTTAARHDPSRWREVLLLSVAHAGKNYAGVVWDFVPCLCREEPDPPPPETLLAKTELWGVHLAGLALLEVETDPNIVGPRDRPVLRRVRKRLALAIRDDRLPAAERAKAAVSLAVLGDTRDAVLDVDAMPFCYVPPGPFAMGADEVSQDEDPNIQDIYDSAKPSHTVNVPTPYWLAQFPVTNAQFQMFVEADGYQDPHHWEQAIANDLWEDGQVQGYTWIAEKNDFEWVKRTRPHDYGRPFNLPNHPVVGVNWYEALAFCHWLTRRWRQQGRLPKDWQVRLPTEAEWEKAARGGQTIPETPHVAALTPGLLRAPSQPLQEGGSTVQPVAMPEQANYRDSKIGATSGVGCFRGGRSPYGCEEMLGNVWEWTRSRYGRYDAEKSTERVAFDPLYPYPYRSEDGREPATGTFRPTTTTPMGFEWGCPHFPTLGADVSGRWGLWSRRRRHSGWETQGVSQRNFFNFLKPTFGGRPFRPR
jgi:formylglycine-generating enzyme required for sulfatase activity